MTGIDKAGNQASNTLSDALRGDVQAQFELARSLEEEEKEGELALGWYKKAALQGHWPSAHRAALICLKGDKLQQKDAAFWLMKAATGGHPPSQYQLGLLYERGIGVELNPEEGLRWIRLAAKHGDADAKARIDGMNTWFDQVTTGEMINPLKKKNSIA